MGKEASPRAQEKKPKEQVRKSALRKTSRKEGLEPAKAMLKEGKKKTKNLQTKEPKKSKPGSPKDLKEEVLRRAEEANKAQKRASSKQVGSDQTKAKKVDKSKGKTDHDEELVVVEKSHRKKESVEEKNAAKAKTDKKSKKDGKTEKDQKEEEKTDKKSKKDGKTEKDQKEEEEEKTDKKSEKDGKTEKDQKELEREEKKQKKAVLQVALTKESLPPCTPPMKRLRMKSPATSTTTDASTEHYAGLKEKAAATLKDKLENAVFDAELRAELDSSGMLVLLEDLKDQKEKEQKPAKTESTEKKKKKDDDAEEQLEKKGKEEEEPSKKQSREERKAEKKLKRKQEKKEKKEAKRRARSAEKEKEEKEADSKEEEEEVEDEENTKEPETEKEEEAAETTGEKETTLALVGPTREEIEAVAEEMDVASSSGTEESDASEEKEDEPNGPEEGMEEEAEEEQEESEEEDVEDEKDEDGDRDKDGLLSKKAEAGDPDGSDDDESEDDSESDSSESEEEDEEEEDHGEPPKKEGTNCKKEWDKFDRQIKSGGLPAGLAPFLKKKKQDIFGLWLDHQEDWSRVELEVQRLQESKNLSRKQWTAVQYKVLETKMDPDKLKELVAKRTEQGLYYPDEDFPSDPKETWYYMPEGRVVRQDDSTAEIVKMGAKKRVNPELQAALTAEDGPLPSGALPSVKAASEAGVKNLFSALDDENKNMAKPKKAPKPKEAEEVKPKTFLEEAQALVPLLLDGATKARAKSIQLHGLDFASELSAELLKHGAKMETLYTDLKKGTSETAVDTKYIKGLMVDATAEIEWFSKAEASAAAMIKGPPKKKAAGKAKAKAKAT